MTQEGYSISLRNARSDQITANAGAGAKLFIYSGTRPATGGAAGTLLATLTCGSPFAPAASSGVLLPNLPAPVTISGTGTASWYRVTKADGVTQVIDGSVGTSGAGMIVGSTAFATGITLTINDWEIDEGNP